MEASPILQVDTISGVFVEVADTLVDDFDIIEFLRRVATHASDIGGGSAVGLMLSDETGRLQFMAASSEDAALLELFQLQTAQGPCMDCHRTGKPVVNSDLATATSGWPLFAPRAMQLGFRAVHAFPMRHRNRVIGAMNLFGREPAPVAAPHTSRVLQALADVATIGIIQERAIAQAETLTEQLQAALSSRVVIEQAKGAVARSFEIGVDEAFERIRAHARRHNLKLTDLARRVVTEPESISELDPAAGPTRPLRA